MTHKEVVERVLNDPDQRAADAQQPRLIGAQRAYLEAATGVLADLERAGLPVEAVQDLYQLQLNYGPPAGSRHIDYRAAVPVLVDWLTKVTYPPVIHDIMTALSYSFAKKQARPVLLRLFRNPPDASPFALDSIRSRMGIVLGDFADPSVADEYLDLALDRRHGEARAGIVLQLPKTKDERVPEALIRLLEDPTVAPFAAQALGRIRYAPARPHLEQALRSPDENVQHQAKRGLKRLDP